MIPSELVVPLIALVMLVPIFFFVFGYAVGGLVEHRRSQKEIDILSQVIKENVEERGVKEE